MAVPIVYSAWEGNFRVVVSICLRRLHDSKLAAGKYDGKALALWFLKSPAYQSFRAKVLNFSDPFRDDTQREGKGLYEATSEFLSLVSPWLDSALQAPIGGHDKLVMTFSNVGPRVVKANAGAIDLDLAKVDLGRLNQLVQQRNEIGHGGLFTPPGEKELGELIGYTSGLIKSFNRAARSWLQKS
jgi:hypothetical protein